MRPALQRLLSRPSSLEILRYLVKTPAANAPAKRVRKRLGRGQIGGCRYASTAVVALEIDRYNCSAQDESSQDQSTKRSPRPAQPLCLDPLVESNTATSPVSSSSTVNCRGRRYGRWDERLWTQEQLDFETNLDVLHAESSVIRLLDTPQHEKDWTLWACLFEYRKRIFGYRGVLTFWNAIRRRDLRLPTAGYLSNVFWPPLLSLGLEDHTLLDQICQYADKMFDEHSERWPKLYVYVVQHFLLSGQGDAASKWHERLFRRHSPGPRGIAEMCRQVTLREGDMATLRKIYSQNLHRNAYSKVVPVLCKREDFNRAFDWHVFFLHMGDVPSTSKMVEPLVKHLAVYDPPKARRVTKGLVAAGVSFASTLSQDLNDNTKISREMMNLAHGKTFNISVKKYNDGLGARWFATKWVSLNVAINSVHALGVEEIGPLSLQAIALREPEAKDVVLRINQLRDLGISIGNSVFSRAVEHFARNRKYDHLESLLTSDQHPDVLEDGPLQESLLTSYAQARDWTQFRRTLEIRALISKSPAIERSNIVLRFHISRGSRAAVTQMLADMQNAGTPVTTKSTAHLLKYTLRPRRAGHRPITVPGFRNRSSENDLYLVISILKSIIRSGSYVPILYWREVIRRLGKIGRFNDLQKLCRELAAWYGPMNSSSVWPPRRFRVPAQIPPSHSLHPLKMLFNTPLQKAIVEWGFIHSLVRRPAHSTQYTTAVVSTAPLPDIACGVRLLKDLKQHGVHINGMSVRSALFNRLITYYGDGTSNRRYNRLGKSMLRGKIDVVAKQIDDALGGKYFTAVDLRKLVREKAKTRLRVVARKKFRRGDLLRSRDPQLRIGGELHVTYPRI